MKESLLKKARDVAFTTCLAFTLICFFYMAMMAIVGDRAGGNTSVFTYFSYTLGKLFCIFLFSLSLGFLNRLFDTKMARSLARVTHFFLSLFSYSLTLILMFYTMFDAKSLTTQGALLNLILFLVGYPLVLGLTALGRAIFLPKEQRSYRNILD